MSKQFSLFILSICMFLISCKKSNDSNTYAGTDVTVYKGTASTFYTTTTTGDPDQLGISMDDNLLNSLPSGLAASEQSFVININPKAGERTPFDHIELDWNPNGHPPAGLYDLPHFDIHFYMVPDAEVQGATDSAKLEAIPQASYLPVNYINGPSVPAMGKHWIDITSGEFPPKPGNSSFTQTFLYGSYNSKITFYEPMITKAFLQSTTYFERSIPQPSKFQRTGFFPTHMIITKVNNKTQVIIDKFVSRQAS